MFGDFSKLFGEIFGGSGKDMSFSKEWYDFRMFAIQHHGDQKYGKYPYAYHLAMVETYLRDHGFNETHYAIAAWLHDIVEDTMVDLNTLYNYYGGPITSIVWACTGEGNNRKEKAESIYKKIETYPEAAPVKCADRLANTYFSWKSGNLNKMKMYVEEWPEFNKRIGSLMHEDQRSSWMIATLEGNIERCKESIAAIEGIKDEDKEKDGPET